MFKVDTERFEYINLCAIELLENLPGIFEIAVERYPNIDIYQFINDYMNSRVKLLTDLASVKFVNLPYPEVLDYLLQETRMEIHYNGPLVMDQWQAAWIGEMYARLQLKLGLTGCQVIGLYLVHYLYRVFYPLHETALEVAADKLVLLFPKDNITFWEVSTKYGYLSNSYPCEFSSEGVLWNSVTQYLMWNKAMMFSNINNTSIKEVNLKIASDIFKETSQKRIEILGSLVEGFDQLKWNEVRSRVAKKRCTQSSVKILNYKGSY